MVTIHSNVDDDIDRIYKFLRTKRGLDEAEATAIVDQIYEDADDVGIPPIGRFQGLTFHRARNGYFLWFVATGTDIQVYAVYHSREEYDKVIHGRAEQTA
ncbi:hypothetical protein [Rhizobium sp. NFACC06-2]|uniref:hypothetical protein n=1 Tax=Rhizobium/Agrobacterium group TaxID=227290 RepID=UPI00087737F5|nr:hypothetical protein [Rhizobium sp. NFACC06-2]SCY12626.1 hypothetical protein SAMN03159288_01364 [Rhizobium sp. NFACC06-2]